MFILISIATYLFRVKLTQKFERIVWDTRNVLNVLNLNFPTVEN